MSPEQIRNDPQDPRSDVFQVGAVLYEMLTGRPAFPGSSAAERLFAVLARDPDPIDNPDVAASLYAAVMRALARDPERRYPSTAAFLSDLQAVAGGQRIGDLPDALAILDFDNSRKPRARVDRDRRRRSPRHRFEKSPGAGRLAARTGAEGCAPSWWCSAESIGGGNRAAARLSLGTCR